MELFGSLWTSGNSEVHHWSKWSLKCCLEFEEVFEKYLRSIWQTSLVFHKLAKVVVLQFEQVMVSSVVSWVGAVTNKTWGAFYDINSNSLSVTRLTSRLGDDKLMSCMSSISPVTVNSLVSRYLLSLNMWTVRFWKW